MKIGIIHGFVGGGGGTEKTLLSIIEALVEQNFTVNLYTVSKPAIQMSGVKINSILPFRLPLFGLYQRYLESQLVKKAKNDDLVLQTSGGLVVPQNSNQKIIVYCHNDFQNEIEKTVSKYRGIWKWYYKPYYKLSQKFLDHIKSNNLYLIANSTFIQTSIKDRFDKYSTVIHPPVELDEFSSNDNKTEKSVITISRFSPEKNLEFAIDVISDMDVDYMIIGNTKTKTNELYYKQLVAKIKNQKPKARITLLKNVPRAQIISAINKSKVYFHTSPETFGISVIESTAAGCIPIVPNNSAHKETVPFEELRYNQSDIEEAKMKVKKAISRNYDEFLKPLQEHVKEYDKKIFKKEITDYIHNICK